MYNYFCYYLLPKVIINKMELLQSQAPVEGELSGNSAVRNLDIGVQTLDIRVETLDIRVRTLDIDVLQQCCDVQKVL